MLAFPVLVTGSACLLMLVLIILGIEPNTHPPIHPKGLLVVFFFLFLTTGMSIYFSEAGIRVQFFFIFHRKIAWQEIKRMFIYDKGQDRYYLCIEFTGCNTFLPDKHKIDTFLFANLLKFMYIALPGSDYQKYLPVAEAYCPEDIPVILKDADQITRIILPDFSRRLTWQIKNRSAMYTLEHTSKRFLLPVWRTRGSSVRMNICCAGTASLMKTLFRRYSFSPIGRICR